jgi:DnaK suppressor protein
MSKINESLKIELKVKLTEEKSKLESELQKFAKPTGTPGDYETKFEDFGSDRDENASEVEAYSDNLGIENSLEERLKDVNDALERIDKGIYGICENCNQEIDEERLRAYPAARTCIKCK